MDPERRLQLIDRVSIEVRAVGISVGSAIGTGYRRCVENRNKRNSRKALLTELIGVDLAGRLEAWRTDFEGLSLEEVVGRSSVERLQLLLLGIDAVVASDD